MRIMLTVANKAYPALENDLQGFLTITGANRKFVNTTTRRCVISKSDCAAGFVLSLGHLRHYLDCGNRDRAAIRKGLSAAIIG